MGNGLAKANMIGNLTRDPEMRTSANGTEFTRFCVATNVGWGDQEKSLFMNCTVFGKSASIIQQYTRKGSKIYVEGGLEPNDYTSKDGNQVKGFQLVVRDFKLLDPKNPSSDDGYGGGNRSRREEKQETPRNDMPDTDGDGFDTDDDLPF